MRCRRSDASAPLNAQSGAALVVALLVFGLSTVLLVAMKSEFLLFYQRGSNLFLAEQGQAYLRGAEELAALILVMDYDEDQSRDQPRDDLSEMWAQQAAPYPLDDGGMLTGSLVDLQGRFNLNNLAVSAARNDDGGDDSKRFTAAQAQFIRLLQTIEEPLVSRQDAISLTQKIGDWLDEDNATRADGAEDDYYLAQTPAYRAANRSMTSVSELRTVATVTPELYRAMAPLLTVWPQMPSSLNIHTAPLAVLRSINADDDLAPLTAADGIALYERQRGGDGFLNMDDFFADPIFAEKAVAGIRSLLGENSSWFLLSAEVEVADRNMRLYSVLQRDRRTIRALARANGSQ